MIRLHGELGAATMLGIRDALARVVQASELPPVIDLTDTTFPDPNGLDVLIAVRRLAPALGFICPCPRVRELLATATNPSRD